MGDATSPEPAVVDRDMRNRRETAWRERVSVGDTATSRAGFPAQQSDSAEPAGLLSNITRTETLGNLARKFPLRILTHNIRYATDTPEEHELLWKDRFLYLSKHFRYHTRASFTPPSALVCMQEVLHPQLEDLLDETFNDNDKDWAYIGVGRDDGATKGEYNPILYRRSAWKCIHYETVWLNEDRTVGKKGWDASSVRILTVGVLESVLPEANGKTVLALNTHLDDQGVVARREAARVVLRVAFDLQSRFPAISFTFLSGDLNSTPDGDAYKVLNGPESGFCDARSLVHPRHDSNVYGDELTFTGFPGDRAAEGRERIDFVLIGVRKSSEDQHGADFAYWLDHGVKGYGVLPNRFDDGKWLSDHRGVVVDLMI